MCISVWTLCRILLPWLSSSAVASCHSQQFASQWGMGWMWIYAWSLCCITAKGKAFKTWINNLYLKKICWLCYTVCGTLEASFGPTYEWNKKNIPHNHILLWLSKAYDVVFFSMKFEWSHDDKIIKIKMWDASKYRHLWQVVLNLKS